ncbi:response regulator [Xylophilus sp. Kf1]|nr:response regulator [Xylophilus sp. Kf1]
MRWYPESWRQRLLQMTAPSRPTDHPDFHQKWHAEAENDLRIAQSVALVRHMPMIILSNGFGMLLAAFALVDHHGWTQLVPMLVGMAYLLAPVAISWWRLRRRGRPISVSPNHLRRQIAYSAVLGGFWSVCLLYYLGENDVSSGALNLLCIGAAAMTLGASATLFVLPLAALAYSLPLLGATLVISVALRDDDMLVRTGSVCLICVATLWTLWNNWLNFREVVRLIHEKSRLLHEAEATRMAEEEFVENLNHEMRNALTSIIGYFEVASNPALLPHEHQELIEHARETGGLLQVLLSDLLDVGRLNAGRTRLALSPFSFRHLVRTSVLSASSAINGRNLVVRHTVDPSVPEVLIGDATRLQQILLNLIGNAIKVMDSGSITVQARYRGNFNPLLEIVVRDDGPGIPRERQKSLFNRFARVSAVPSSTGPTVGGWGLGLSICSALVELMRGDIRVQSEPGHGAAFTIRLPLHEERRRLPREDFAHPSIAPKAALNFSTLAVLVVDDTAANRLILRKMLQALGCKVEVASSGAEAVALCSARRFDMVFMDLELGAMDGLTATRLIRALPGHGGSMAIVAITGFASMDRVASIQEAGMNDHVLKPVRLDTVTAVLQKWAH